MIGLEAQTPPNSGGGGTTPPESGAGESEEKPPVLHVRFAVVSGLVAIAVGAVLLFDLARNADGIEKSDWLGSQADSALAASIAIPLTVFGGFLLVVGAWMAVVEWRGRFVSEEEARPGDKTMAAPDPAAIIAAIGKLKGAALLLVVGAVLMLGAAWVVRGHTESNKSDNSGTTSTPTTTSPESTQATTTGD
jgi:hypothetical protein